MSASFDKKLAELDAYLQMLIVENESLDKKLAVLSATSSSSSSLQNITAHESEREGISSIKTNLETLISSIKHAIVLLQIAKVSSKGTNSSSQLHSGGAPRNSLPAPPTRPIRSLKHTPSFGSGMSRDSGSNNSSIDCSGGSVGAASSSSYISQHNNAAQRRQNKARNGSPQTKVQPSIAAAAAPLEATSKAPEQRQRDGSAEQHRALGSSSSSPASAAGLAQATTSENRHHSSKKNEAAVNLSETSASGGGGSSGDDSASVNKAHVNEERDCDPRELGAGVVEDDDEDAFFDAADEQLPKHTNSILQPESGSTVLTEAPRLFKEIDSEHDRKHIDNLNALPNSSSTMASPAPAPANQTAGNDTNETNNNDDETIEDGTIDWDAMYEDEEEEELDSLEGQGSVIKHLLSQIRIGMDLTKVVLPTFILERRSLLEMYADFFAHPDLFSAIPDFETPEERMVQLVKWYLSAFHAGRRSSVAKKPYNPILGEIFRCSWRLSEGNSVSGGGSGIKRDRMRTISESCNNSEAGQQLTFVAEQVSHHPPVSAFYAENKEKRISCCAHIYTKSKYLGLSVGVHNLGQGTIHVSKHSETYVCTFPSAYGRSILTVPWVELGGSVNIDCLESGYKANIEFLTKPFYGGKKHRVTGEILRPNSEPFLAIDGEWNGVMFSKTPPNSSRKEVFVDTTNLPVIRKHVKLISAQETFESRNVWKEVTRALKIRDVNSATAAKTYIEQRQRDLLKERQEKGDKWKTRYFEPTSGEAWRFSEQLDAGDVA